MIVEYILVKKEDPFCNSVDSFNSLIMSNSEIAVSSLCSTGSSDQPFAFDIKVGSSQATYTIRTELIDSNKKERYFYIAFIAEDELQEITEVEALECITRQFKKTVLESGRDFVLSVIWDEVSQYYCKEGYPIVNNVENLLRKLIYQFMIQKVGGSWTRKTMPENLKKSMSKRVGQFENCLYEADFIQLMDFLFKPYSIECPNYDDMIKLIHESDNLEKLKNIAPRSNWDKYFSSVVNFNNLQEEWNKLYELRNKVAHNKPFTKKDFKDLDRIASDVTIKLTKALEQLNEISVPDSDKETVGKIAEDIIEDGDYSTLSSMASLKGATDIANFSALSATLPKTLKDLAYFSALSTKLPKTLNDPANFSALSATLPKTLKDLTYFSALSATLPKTLNDPTNFSALSTITTQSKKLGSIASKISLPVKNTDNSKSLKKSSVKSPSKEESDK